MIASRPVRLLSLMIVALVFCTGAHGVVSGLTMGAVPLDTSPGPASERTAGVVHYVLDGDTVQVTTDGGRDVRVRLLGISAPEIPHPGKPGECYGDESTRRLEKLLPAGTRVVLITDPTQDDLDNYGRWLRYLEVAGRDVGRAQIRSGAATARDRADLVSRLSSYQRAEVRARMDDAGMWDACE